MEAHVQIANAGQAGSPSEPTRTRRLKRTLPVALAALVLAPGVLLAAPLRQALDNLVVATTASKVMLDLEPLMDEGRVHRRAESHRHIADGEGGGGGVARPPVLTEARQSAREGLLKLADFQATVASQGTDGALVGDEQDDGALMAAGGRRSSDMASDASAIGGAAPIRASSAYGGGFGSGLGGGGGVGARAGALADGSPAGPGGSISGSDDATPALTPLSNGLSALSAAPEPAAWMSLILGFGLTGAMMRRRHSLAGVATQR